jgi:bacillopeptidase F (M6 metalloprotease family)
MVTRIVFPKFRDIVVWSDHRVMEWSDAMNDADALSLYVELCLDVTGKHALYVSPEGAVFRTWTKEFKSP